MKHMSDEAKECIKEQVGLLNKMLKTMIPLYGTNIAGKGQQLVRHQQKQVHVKSEPHHVHPQEHTRPNQIQTQVHVKQEIVRESTGVTLLQPHAHVKQARVGNPQNFLENSWVGHICGFLWVSKFVGICGFFCGFLWVFL